MVAFRVENEFAPLAHVVLGRGEGYHRDPARVEIVNTTQARTHAAQGHPAEAQLCREFNAFGRALEAAGAVVHQPELAPASVQDQTCPRDIGFVIGQTFVTAGMRHASRVEEITAVETLLAGFDGPRVTVPEGVTLEGGDVVLDGAFVFVGCGQRSDPEGAVFLEARLGDDHRIVPVPTRALSEGEEVLHLDCAFNPLGLGHALIYPAGLSLVPDLMRERYDWIEVTREEAAALATNVLSVAPDHVIARSHPSCARTNKALKAAGYNVTEVDFDAVPGTGGSFRCATLPLQRAHG